MVTGFQKTIDGDVQGLRAILSQNYPRGLPIPKRAARASRALKITLPAKMERLCPDRGCRPFPAGINQLPGLLLPVSATAW